MSKTFGIYIPTWKRAGTGEATTLNLVKKELVTLVVRPEEEAYYREEGWRLLVLPNYVDCLGSTRQYTIETVDEDYVWFIDDDLKNHDFHQGIEYISYYVGVEDAGIFGFGRHFLLNIRLQHDGIFTRRGSTGGLWGVNRRKYLSSVNSNGWDALEDLHTWIGMQVAGHRALISNQFIMHGGEAKHGGCVDTRSKENIIAALQKLQSEFPNYFSIHETDRGTVQRMSVGVNFRTSWAKIHKEIPRV